MNFFIKMLKILKVDKEVESITFKKYTKEMLEGYKIESDKSINENALLYIKAFDEYEEIIENEYNYIFENYLVNFIYNMLRKFSIFSHHLGLIQSKCLMDLLLLFFSGVYSEFETIMAQNFAFFR